ncbi:NAD(+) diphosphatase [Companilactobacillus metriopterae]|uniref:NAD(+) diphosphatase n=1 Tax=Companilactobacillus metriopterae TaxID=1909267 RepID=UPI00100BD7A1|nr:NAD(+) diphosphatase [Companilactobacillus metriopterae]
MLQDIAPKTLNNQYEEARKPKDNDLVVIYSNRQVILNSHKKFPTVIEAQNRWNFKKSNLIYLLSVDEIAFYLTLEPITEDDNYQYNKFISLRKLEPKWMSFVGATSTQLAEWYENNKFCGRCGSKTTPDDVERALYCSNCNQKIYPNISPAIIVGVTNGDKILLTKFLSGYDRYALISGYSEIGETFEDTVRREVMEEVGLSVHNIRYFGSQPWPFSHSLLTGYFAEVDEDIAIQLETDELSKAQWFSRKKKPTEDTIDSLTWTMIEAFRREK